MAQQVKLPMVVVMVAVVVVASLVPGGNCSPTLPHHSNSTNRNEKLILVVSPQACESSGRTGACLPYFQCDKVSGAVKSKCSLGLGDCCVFEKTCGGSSSARVTYFTSSSNQATVTGTCSVSITKASNVCQLRLDMNGLELSEPNAEGVCEKQYLQVQGVSGDSPRICGTNSGQHLYVDVQADNGPFTVAVVNTVSNPSSSWDIEVEQIRCDSTDLAPPGCSQYYTGLTGAVKSFNHDTTASSELQPSGDPGSRHLQETYTMCVRQEPGYCSLKWTAAPGEDYAFTLTGMLIPNPNIPITIFNVVTDDLCPFTDYLIIPDGRIPLEPDTSSVFCGSLFPESVTSDTFQAIMVANTQEFNDNELDNRGFHLNYEQIAC